MALVPSSFLNHPDSHTSASREAQAGAWLDMMKVSGAFVTTNLILPWSTLWRASASVSKWSLDNDNRWDSEVMISG
jgi:hypothetical protein